MASVEPRILIYLLRRDLRLGDNPVFHRVAQALQAEKKAFTHFLPLYVFAPKQIEVSGFLKPADAGGPESSPYPEARSSVGKFWRCGPHRAKFLADSIFDLKQSLQSVKSDLCLRLGPPGDVIRDALHFYDTDQGRGKVAGVWMVSEDTDEEVHEQNDVKRVVENAGVEFKLFKDEKYFVDDDDLPFDNIADLSDVFTEFKKKVQPLRERPRPVLPYPTKLPPFPDQSLLPPLFQAFHMPDAKDEFVKCLLKPLDASNGLKTTPARPADDMEAHTAHPFSGGETAATKRLRHLIASGAMTAYKNTRNGMVGTEFSTKLSAWLALGSITARQIHASMSMFEDGRTAAQTEEEKAELDMYRKAEGFGQGENAGTAAVRFELLWRDYMRLCARKFGARLFYVDGFRGDQKRKWERPQVTSGTAAQASEKVNRILCGHSGIGLVDASQRELFWTGYTSNRARQNVASFMAKELGIDWRLGAEWYESMLIDYDVASNWGNWQYVAGVGNDPREGRKFNPVKQSFDYDSRGEYVLKWIPELRAIDQEPINGNKQKLMTLFQPWQIEDQESRQLGIAEYDWYRNPLAKIKFEINDPRYSNSGSRGGRSNRGQNHRRGGRGRGGPGRSDRGGPGRSSSDRGGYNRGDSGRGTAGRGYQGQSRGSNAGQSSGRGAPEGSNSWRGDASEGGSTNN